MAKANILALSGWTVGAFSVRIAKPGDESSETICAERSTIPTGVVGEAVEVGDVVVDVHDDGVSGVAGGDP
jgi:hypothetical protein